MTNVNIVVPVNRGDYEVVKNYYTNTLLFKESDGLIFLPINNFSVGLLIMKASADDGILPVGRKQLPSFSFEIEKNFLSFCLKLYRRGALFDMACRHPGGYYARIFDPAGNQFEVLCDSDKEDDIVDIEEMPFFFSY